MSISRKVIAGSGAAGLVLAAAIYGGTALAQSASPSGTPNAGYQTFIQHLAQRLNISQSAADSAVKGAATDSVADAAKAGTITQAQATKIDQRIANGGIPGFAFGKGHGRGPGGGFAPSQVLNAAASSLNLQPADLMSQLRSGKSLQDIAKAQNVDFSKVQSAITSAVKPGLDQAVANGKLTSRQETNILSRITSGTFGVGHFGHGPRPGRPASPKPS